MEQEVNIKTVCIATESAEKVSSVFRNALTSYIEMQKHERYLNKQRPKQTNKEHGGKIVKVKDLRKDGAAVEFVDMGDDELKNFRKYARRYGVTYSMEKNRETTPPTYLIFFKAKDSTLINKAISEYVADKMKATQKEGGIKEKLIAAKDKMINQPNKVKHKEHIR